MDKEFRRRIAALTAEAEQAVDERSNGLMDRSDFRHLLERFLLATHDLIERCEELERQQTEMHKRLCRSRSAEFELPVTTGLSA